MPEAGALQAACDELLADFRRQPATSARACLVTIFGDSVEPHGAEVWIGSLAQLVEPLGFNERLVRTSLNRLVHENLVGARRLGRRSFYGVTAAARAEFARAEARIYHRRREPWDGRFTLVAEPGGLGALERATLRQHLGWLGFGSFSPTLHVTALDRTAETDTLLGELGLSGRVALLRAEAGGAGLGHGELAAATATGLPGLAIAWQDFLERFSGLADAAEGAEGSAGVSPETAFVARTLLVHAYRRVALKEPELPAELWPADWEGDTAFALAGRAYRALDGPAEAHLRAVAVTPDGPLGRRDSAYAARYRTAPRPARTVTAR